MTTKINILLYNSWMSSKSGTTTRAINVNFNFNTYINAKFTLNLDLNII